MVEVRADGAREAYPLYQGGDGGAKPTSALQLFFGRITLWRAAALNRLWHSRLPDFGRPTCRVAYGAEFGGLYYAVAIWTNPLARRLPQLEWMELNRMAIAPDSPKNTASRMLGWMARDIARTLSEVTTLCSYQDADVHAGTIYRASGWTATAVPMKATWNNSTRPHAGQGVLNKIRWEKSLGH